MVCTWPCNRMLVGIFLCSVEMPSCLPIVAVVYSPIVTARSIYPVLKNRNLVPALASHLLRLSIPHCSASL